MAIRDIFKVSRKTFLNPAGWMDLDTLKAQNQTLFGVLKTIFTPDKPEREETFEQACIRLNIKESDIKEMIKNYRFFALLFLLFGLGIFAYTIYLLIFYHSLTGLLLGLATTALFFSQAFRYDFWAFQLKQRRLGVTFNEWKKHLFGGKGSP